MPCWVNLPLDPCPQCSAGAQGQPAPWTAHVIGQLVLNSSTFIFWIRFATKQCEPVDCWLKLFQFDLNTQNFTW